VRKNDSVLITASDEEDENADADPEMFAED
jgi:hypothetical protein